MSNEVIKIGGTYKGKDENWLVIQNRLKNGKYTVFDIMYDDGDYDCDILEMDTNEIQKKADISVCYSGKFRDGCLYAVWDGADKDTIRYINK